MTVLLQLLTALLEYLSLFSETVQSTYHLLSPQNTRLIPYFHYYAGIIVASLVLVTNLCISFLLQCYEILVTVVNYHSLS